MKRMAIAGFVLALLAGSAELKAQEYPQLPPPVKEHQWLQQYAGEWESECEVVMDPSKPPMKSKGTESSRLIGGFWVVGEGKSEMMGMPFTCMLTLGYDPQKGKYVGTWVDSCSSYLWKYEGKLDSSGKILTMETEGPCPLAPGKIYKFREVTEFKSKDHRIFKSLMLGDDGKWTTLVTVNSRRKKPGTRIGTAN